MSDQMLADDLRAAYESGRKFYMTARLDQVWLTKKHTLFHNTEWNGIIMTITHMTPNIFLVIIEMSKK